MACGNNGNPVISYWDLTNLRLKVAACTDPACSAATITPLDAVGNEFFYPSITIGTNGNPVISYRGSAALKVAVCGNATCENYPGRSR